MKALLVLLSSILFLSCSTSLKLDSQRIRPWSDDIRNEYPHQKPVIAKYRKNEFELFYLAARHTNTMGEDTLNLVQTLFNKFYFKVLIIESIPYSSGESPQWFVLEAKKGRSETLIKGGESALAAIIADEKKIPFFAGEPDHQEIFKHLKERGYTDLDILAFYTGRQVPQWVRENEDKADLLPLKIPKFVMSYCNIFGVSSCPSYKDIMNWYPAKMGHELVVDVSNEDFAPYSDGKLITQRISAEVGIVRDHYTLNIIERMLAKYKKVAVVYGAGHFLTLRKSFDASLGLPQFIEDKKP